jgi:hypothetical protein
VSLSSLVRRLCGVDLRAGSKFAIGKRHGVEVEKYARTCRGKARWGVTAAVNPPRNASICDATGRALAALVVLQSAGPWPLAGTGLTSPAALGRAPWGARGGALNFCSSLFRTTTTDGTIDVHLLQCHALLATETANVASSNASPIPDAISP